MQRSRALKLRDGALGDGSRANRRLQRTSLPHLGVCGGVLATARVLPSAWARHRHRLAVCAFDESIGAGLVFHRADDRCVKRVQRAQGMNVATWEQMTYNKGRQYVEQ